MLGSKGMPCNLEAWIFHTACQRKAWRSIAIPDNVILGYLIVPLGAYPEQMVGLPKVYLGPYDTLHIGSHWNTWGSMRIAVTSILNAWREPQEYLCTSWNDL